jgi:hypothetical protein
MMKFSIAKYSKTGKSCRFVWLQMTNQRKMLIFCATQDMVDYMTPLLASVLSQKDTIEESSDEENEEKDEEKQNDFKIRSNIHFFRLHGNMTQKVHSAWDNFSHLS